MPHAHNPSRYDVLLVATAGLLSAATIAFTALPVVQLRVMAPALDLSLDTVALVISGLLAVLLWIRYRERHDQFALFQSGAFFVLAVANFIAVLAALTYTADSTLPLSEPGDDMLFVFTAARLIAGVLLVAGGTIAIRGIRTPHPSAVLVVPAIVFIGVIAFVLAGHPAPPLIVGFDDGRPPLMSPFGAAVQLMIGGLFACAAVLARRVWLLYGAIGDKFFALALVLAAFAQVQAAFYPGTHPGPVTTADILLLGFYVVLLLAVEAEARSVLASLRTANETLERLRASEGERASIEERARLSRELHDGLAQALWLAKLKVVRLLSLPGLSDEAMVLARETGDAVELGLGEARQAVLAMHTAANTDSAFCSLLERYVNDYGDRFAIPIEFSGDGVVPPLAARTQAELLRIAQEALANVHRHASARSVAVDVVGSDDEVALTVTDDGVGFDVLSVSRFNFGLAAMRERAGLIGGTLEISSAPGAGTVVSVKAPVRAPAGGTA